MIRFEGVSKQYQRGARPAIDDVSVQIDPEEFVFLVGASGSGKSTFLGLILHELIASSGRIEVLGTDITNLPRRRVPHLRRQIGTVFQDFRLLENRSVFDNVALAMQVIGRSRSEVKQVVPEVLEMVGLTGKEKRMPWELSGGEQQRVAIARAMVNSPKLLLADEPTGNLDPKTSLGIMRLLDRINRSGTTVLMATHDSDTVNQMRKRVIELADGSIARDQVGGFYGSAR